MNNKKDNDSSQVDESTKHNNAKGELLAHSLQSTTFEGSSAIGDQSDGNLQFKNRRTGLVIFGILQISMGYGCGKLFFLELLPQFVGPATGAPMSVRMLVPMLGLYVLLSLLLVWLGVGSILARRWARALTLVLAWMWLAFDILLLITMIVWRPNLFDIASEDKQVSQQIVVLFQIGMICSAVLWPGIFVVFYQSKHVKATCDIKDDHLRWTDKCPLPVLAMSLILGYGSFKMILSVSYGFVTPFFGILLKGIPAGMMILAIILLSAYLAWATYKLKIAAWWTTLAAYITLSVSCMITFSRVEIMDLYRAMNFPEEQLIIIEKSGMINRMNIPLMFGVSLVVFVGYMLWVRRFFVAGSNPNVDL